MAAAVVTVLVAFAALAPPAVSAGPGGWSEVQGPNTLHPGSEISAVRGLDGSLFVAFTDSPNVDLAVSKLDTAGTRLSTEPAIDESSTRPAIARDPDDGTVRALYGGFRSPPGSAGTWMATAPSAGTPWSAVSKVSNISSSYVASAVDPNGVLYVAATIGSPTLHRGTDPATPDHVYDTADGPAGGSLALDGLSGAPTLAWIAQFSTPRELRARAGSAVTGEPTGPVLKAPGLTGATAAARVDQSVPMSGVTGRAGVYTAYADTAGDPGELLLWRVGDALPRQVAVSASVISRVAVAPAPDGSLWIAWVDTGGPVTKIAARQLRPDGTTLGPITNFGPPDTGGFLSLTQLVGVAQADRLDVLLNAGSRIFHTQVLAVPAGPGPGPAPVPGGAAGPGPGGGGGPTAGVLSGRVTQADGVAVPNALVDACAQPSGLCLSVNTGADGRYRFDGLTPGGYRVTAYPPPRSFLNVTTRDGVSTVTAGQELPGQDIRMGGPLRRPGGANMFGPGFHGDVNGVPVIVRNRPIFWYFDIPCTSTNYRFCSPRFEGFATDDPEKIRIVDPPPPGECSGPNPPPHCVVVIPPFIEKDLKPMDPPDVIPPFGDCGSANPPPDCVAQPPVTTTPKPGHFRYGAWLDVSELQRGKSRGWTVCANYATRKIDNGFLSSERVRICYTVWIDPSGFVRTTRGQGIPGAKVVLMRSDAAAGPFAQVTDGSARMAPANRRNPDLSDQTGHFGWDVVSGYYKVVASKSGCTAPSNRKQKSVETRVYEIPPPVTDVDIRLRCPPPPTLARKPGLSGKPRVGKSLTCSTGRWAAKPKSSRPRSFQYSWRRGRSAILGPTGRRYTLRKADRGKRISCYVVARNPWGLRGASSKLVRIR